MKRSDFTVKNIELAKTAQVSLSDLNQDQLAELTKLRELCESSNEGQGILKKSLLSL